MYDGCGTSPQWLFRMAGMSPQNHPQIFMTLGMVLALYGLLYLEVARRPADGFAVAAVGLAGKVLGPAGWLWLYLSGQWPLASGVTILTNRSALVAIVRAQSTRRLAGLARWVGDL